MTDPVVETSHGKIRGRQIDQAIAFLGVPYARAERFEAPVKADCWPGIMDADRFGPMAPQSDPRPDAAGFGIILEKLGGLAPPAASENEDCQTLNIWTASLAPETLRPVMVWLHPGFFMVGTGASGNGAVLAARGDVVLVSLNHRLNIFGYTHLDDIAPGFHHSGNVGQLDIVAALQWIRENIARFGGDPARVMVFGASGGGMKTAWLLASPASQGLLHRAGAQSGPCLELMERDDASIVSERLLSELGLATTQADDLRTLPVERLLAAYHRLRTQLKPRRFTHLASFAPVIDAELLPQHPFSPEAAPAAKDVPMLMGWNRQDMAFFAGSEMEIFDLDEPELSDRLERLLGSDRATAERHYRRADPSATPSEIYLRAYSDWSVGTAVLTQADRKAALGGAPTYVYRFDFPSPAMGGKLGAVHSSETAFVFGTRGPFSGEGETHDLLGRQMRDAWVHFAATGDVNGGGSELPFWPAWDTTRPLMALGEERRVIRDAVPPCAGWISKDQ